jgi:hypothetical protein
MFNHDEFVKKVPFPLVPLNVPGAYACPPPPDGFDLENANLADLVRHGWLWRRPEPGDPPVVAAAWKALTSRRWRATDCIMPQLGPPQPRPSRLGSHRITKRPRGSPHFGGGPSTLNNNMFAGCVLFGNFNAVLGQWVIPTVSQPNEPQGTNKNFPGWWSSSWIGIDGLFQDTGNGLLQAGVEQTVDATGSGRPPYYAWFEWWVESPPPGSPQYVNVTPITNFPVEPGQTVVVGVQYLGSPTFNAGYITFGNVTTGKYITPMTLAPPPTANLVGGCVEWIMEDPGGGYPGFALPKFTPVNFSNACGCSPNGPTTSPSEVLTNPQAGNILGITNGSATVATASVGSGTVSIEYTGN